MRQLVYRSTAVAPFDHARLSALLLRAREFNVALDVTGILLYHQGTFAQCLEGPAEKLQIVWQRIVRDQKHRDLMVLQDSRIKQRSFASWSMACTEISAADWQALEAGCWTINPDQPCTPGLMIMQSLWQMYQDAAF